MTERGLLITNGCILTGAGPVYPDGFVCIQGKDIAAVGPMRDQRPETRDQRSDRRSPVTGHRSRVLDAGGRYVLPGFINPHMHLYSALARGMPAGRMPTFGRVLEKLWWKLDRALSLDDIFVSAWLGGIEAIKAGVTTLVDHHASYGAITGSTGRIAEALSVLGLRASLCFEISDRAGKRARDEAVAETAHLLDRTRSRVKHNKAFLQRAMVGLHASMTLSDGTLDAARELMDIYGVGAHVHVAEGREDVEATRRRNGMTPVARFAQAGILCPGTLAVHCVHVSPQDVGLLKKSRAVVVHNPLSNLNNAVGIAPLPAFFKKRIPVAIGTDGMSAGVAGDIRLASVLHKIAEGDAQAFAQEIRTAVLGTAPALISEMFGMPVGLIAPGAAADVIIVDALPPTEVGVANAWWHVLFGILAAPVRTTIIDGKIRMRDFRLAGIDEAALAREARRLAARLWKRMQ